MTDQTLVTTQPTQSSAQVRRFGAGTQEYFRVIDFLEDEIAILDEGRLMDWLPVLDEDLIYRMPTREIRYAGDGDGFARGMYHFDENKATITVKATRLIKYATAWAENPPSRTRRMLSNVRVFAGEVSGELAVSSSVLLLRTRDNVEFVSARRDDILVERDGVLKLKQRIILVDQSTLHTANLAVFL